MDNVRRYRKDNNIGVLWSKTKGKNSFLSGIIKIYNQEYRIVCFKNRKTNPKQPDYKIYLSQSINTTTTESNTNTTTIKEEDLKKIEIDTSNEWD